MLHLIRFLRGTVEFLILGVFPEKLITKAVSERIPIWGTKKENDILYARSYARNYKQIAKISRKTNTRTKLVKKRGLPFLGFKYRKRWGIATGMLISAILVYYLLSHIWIINIEGCLSIEEETMYQYLEQCGLKIGVPKRKIDSRKIEKEMLLLENRLSWLTVNIDGATVEVVIGESVQSPEKIDPKDRYANVVASQDGVIRRIELYDGQPLLEAGDTVSKGDVIVSGVTDDQYKNTMLRYARAKVIAEVYIETEVTVPLKETVIVESEIPVTEKEIRVLGIKIPSFKESEKKKSLRVETTTWELLYPLLSVQKNDLFLPQNQEISRTNFEAKEECMRRIRALTDSVEDIICVLSEENEIIETQSAVTVKSILYAEKDIAETVEFMAY